MTTRAEQLVFAVVLPLLCCACRSQLAEGTQKSAPHANDGIIMQDITKAPIRIDVNIVDNHLYRGKLPCTVLVRITNVSGEPIFLNKRLEVGYRESDARELFVEVYRPGTDDIVSEGAEDYNRDQAMDQDYGYLGPDEYLATSFDLCEWYHFPPTLEGEFEMVVYYQAEDSSFRQQPESLLKGIHASTRTPFEIIN